MHVGGLNWTAAVVVNSTVLLFWPDTCGQSVFYNALQKQRESCDSLSIKPPVWAVGWFQTDTVLTLRTGRGLRWESLNPAIFFFLFLSLKGGIIIHTLSNPVILFEV